jgi:hypothetical protein
MFTIVNGIETFKNADVHIWKCNGCGCWREIAEQRCTICLAPRTVLLPGATPPKPEPATLSERRQRARSKVSAVGAAELHKVREREAKKSEKPAK